MSSEFQNAMNAGTFKRSIQTLFRIVVAAGWRVKLVISNVKTGEEWEITPDGSVRTKKPSQKVNVRIN